MGRARASIVAAALVAMAPLSAAGRSLPRASDGKPDLSGIWHAVDSAAWTGPNRIDCSVMLEDPKVFTRPWKMAFAVNRNPDKNYEIWEDSRHEGERDVENILSAGRKKKAAGVMGIHEHRREDGDAADHPMYSGGGVRPSRCVIGCP